MVGQWKTSFNRILKGGSDGDDNPLSVTVLCRKTKLCPSVALLADVASSEQQQTTKASGQEQEEEEEAGEILMDTEEELIRAEGTEQLKPEAVKSETATAPGEALVSRLDAFCSLGRSTLCSFLF